MESTHDFTFERAWLNVLGVCQPSEDHVHIEIKEVNSEVFYHEESKRGDEIPALCAAPTDTQARWTLRLLLTPHMYNRDSRRHVAYSASMIDAFVKRWYIAPLCFGDHSSCGMPFSPVPCNPSWRGYMLRFVYSLPFVCTLAITHDSTTRTTYGVCYGVGQANIAPFLQRLRLARDDAFQPYLAPLLITDLALAGLDRFSLKIYDDFMPVREAMGCNIYFQLTQDYQAPDITEMPRRLTALANAIASNTSSMTNTEKIVQDLAEELDTYLATSPEEASLLVQMRDRLTLMRRMAANTKRRNEYVKESVQAQVQMVYALLAQKDNELSLRYGADMRVISVVTLLFLPGTFVATLFSTSFWDFSPGNRGAKVSGWVWLYWIWTVVLTMAVVGIWKGYPAVLERRQRRRRSALDEEMGKKDI